MAQRRGGGARTQEDDEVHEPLQAVLLADSFTQRFRPITMEQPKVLLPLVGVPMIDYTLEWLSSAGVEKVFVFCCAHAEQVTDYLEHSKWVSFPNFKVTCIESHDSASVGDALRCIDEMNVMHGDFVLVSGDTISNMSLKDVVDEHKARRKKDKLAVMTMVIKRAKPSPQTRLTRLGNEELVIALDPDSKQLLYYDDRVTQQYVTLERSDRATVKLHMDMQDCHIDICSPEVLMLFTDNFDYQRMRRDFVRGLLSDEIMGNKLFTYEITEEYAARIDNFRSYDTVSKDVLHRWTYPLVPDIQFSSSQERSKLDRFNIYQEEGLTIARTAFIGINTFIGRDTKIGENSVVENSVIGRGCKIGKDVVIDGCYLWNNVTVHDGAKLRESVLCDEVVVGFGARLEPGAVLSFKVVIGDGFAVPSYSKISRVPQPTLEDSSDEELEYSDADGKRKDDGILRRSWDAAEVGNDGAGFKWFTDEEEDWRHSVATITLEKIKELALKQEQYHEDISEISETPLKPEAEEVSSEETIDDQEYEYDDQEYDFEEEVDETFRRAVNGVQQENVVIEVNSLKLAYNKEFSDCAGAMLKAVLSLALEGSHSSSEDLLKKVGEALKQWASLLRCFIKSVDEEIEMLLKFEDLCSEGAHAKLAPLFCKIVQQLYDKDLVSEEAIMSWASEKQGGDESDKVFLKQCQPFIKWLGESEEEEDEEEEGEDEDDEDE